MASNLPPVWIKKRILDKNGSFSKWHVVSVPGEWEIPDNPQTPAKLHLDFLDPRMGWERATNEEAAQAQSQLAQLQANAAERRVERKVNEVLAQEIAMEQVRSKVEAKREALKLGGDKTPAAKTAKPTAI